MSLRRRRNGADRVTLYADSCWDDLAVLHAARWSIAQLLVVGSLLLLTTFCCRLENFFLAPSAPEIDLTELSPRLAAIKIPVDACDAKPFQVRRPPQDATVLV
ncbi:hypothetical protein PHYPSEUDO_008336 [Phytophthora pseudosyringae]|uniref:Uncharacterized protein n=1 Tax=Phytophthora pseudosyringae TaxID=221518 RepID=A0A8T1VHN5_9STRA|nr:hypothetical protein PHYPSEUDO_008336 [Phytophthora pseudosyringae]